MSDARAENAPQTVPLKPGLNGDTQLSTELKPFYAPLFLNPQNCIWENEVSHTKREAVPFFKSSRKRFVLCFHTGKAAVPPTGGLAGGMMADGRVIIIHQENDSLCVSPMEKSTLTA